MLHWILNQYRPTVYLCPYQLPPAPISDVTPRNEIGYDVSGTPAPPPDSSNPQDPVQPDDASMPLPTVLAPALAPDDAMDPQPGSTDGALDPNLVEPGFVVVPPVIETPADPTCWSGRGRKGEGGL